MQNPIQALSQLFMPLSHSILFDSRLIFAKLLYQLIMIESCQTAPPPECPGDRMSLVAWLAGSAGSILPRSTSLLLPEKRHRRGRASRLNAPGVGVPFFPGCKHRLSAAASPHAFPAWGRCSFALWGRRPFCPLADFV